MRESAASVVGLAIVMVLAGVAVAQQLDIHFIDVGQGDAILLDYGELELLIDGGRGDACRDYITGLIDGELEIVVATHMDADHIGGLVEVFESFDVVELWTNGDTSTTATYGAFQAAYVAERCTHNTGRAGDTIAFHEDVSLQVLHPETLVSESNDNSLVLLLEYSGWISLFTGDITSEVERNLLQDGILPDIDILKVSHSGSPYSTCVDFLRAVDPMIFVISVGENAYGHPSEDVLQRITCYWEPSPYPDLVETNRYLYRTDVHGSVVIEILHLLDATGRTSSGIDPEPLEQPCDCTGPDLDYEDFESRERCQQCHDCCLMNQGWDVFNLDRDGDGVVDPPEPVGGVVINEVEPNPAGDDRGREWVELYNAGVTSVDIGGWTICSTHGRTSCVSIPYGTTIAPGQFLCFSQSAQWIDNSDEAMKLLDRNGNLVDQTPNLADGGNDNRTLSRVSDGAGNWVWVRQGATKGYSNE